MVFSWRVIMPQEKIVEARQIRFCLHVVSFQVLPYLYVAISWSILELNIGNYAEAK